MMSLTMVSVHVASAAGKSHTTVCMMTALAFTVAPLKMMEMKGGINERYNQEALRDS